jgi:4-amino-4-deoxy-L-arabinose transferase-like glycosyltransferase
MVHRAETAQIGLTKRLFTEWRSLHSCLLLAALTLVCLIPFCGKAFHIDDTLFVWAAQQIAQHPLDPYGFSVIWYWTKMPMAEVTQNPPAAAYYIAAVGKVAGWSEVAMHLAFLIPALVVVLGTYHLARRFTKTPLLAAAATLLAPGFLVSSTNVMCDTLMLAAWLLATIFWLNGLDWGKPWLLALSSLMMAFCVLTKYFGIASIPLLLVYSISKKRRIGSWALFFLVPGLVLAGYQHWTSVLYGKGLLSQAAEYSSDEKVTGTILAGKTLLGLSFAGGCALPVFTFIPVVWTRRSIFLGSLMVAAVGLWCEAGPLRSTLQVAQDFHSALQLSLFIAGGISLLALVLSDLRKCRNADSAFLALWVLGTFAFAAFVNWTVNGRSLLPLIPAAGILLARRVDSAGVWPRMAPLLKCIAPLAVAGIVSIWVTWADTRLADSARLAAQYVRDRVEIDAANVSFEGHWGFQYYMQRLGYRAVDFASYRVATGKVLVVPKNNCNMGSIPPQLIESQSSFSFDTNTGVTTTSDSMGAGFYTDVFGPVPFAFGRVPAERYKLVRLRGSGLLDPDDGK